MARTVRCNVSLTYSLTSSCLCSFIISHSRKQQEHHHPNINTQTPTGTYTIDFADEQSTTTLKLGKNPIAELLFVKKDMRVWFDISEMNNLRYLDYGFNRYEEQSLASYDIRFPSSIVSLSFKGNRNLRSGFDKVLEAVNRDISGLVSLEAQMIGAQSSSIPYLIDLANNQTYLKMLGLSGNRYISKGK